MIRCETVGILQVRKVLLVRVRDALLAECVRKVEVQRIDLELLSGKQRYLDMDLASLKNMHDAPTSRRGGIGTAGMAAVAIGFAVLLAITVTHLPKTEAVSRD